MVLVLLSSEKGTECGMRLAPVLQGQLLLNVSFIIQPSTPFKLSVVIKKKMQQNPE